MEAIFFYIYFGCACENEQFIFNFNKVAFKRETTIVLGQYDEVCFEAFLSD